VSKIWTTHIVRFCCSKFSTSRVWSTECDQQCQKSGSLNNKPAKYFRAHYFGFNTPVHDDPTGSL